MVWPIDTAKTIFLRMGARLETAVLRIRSDIDPIDLSRAVYSARGMFSQILRAIAPEIREVQDHQAYWGRQYMPDSADAEEAILSHSSIWGVPQRGALKAVGTVLIEGAAGTVLPSGIELSSGAGALYLTTAGGTIAAGGTLTVAAIASEAGVTGNLETGVRLATVTSFSAISRITVATSFAGGADEQTLDELKAAYLTRIRQAPHGGAGFDYPVWVRQVADAKAVAIVPDWIGFGSLGVVVVMNDEDNDPRQPTLAEIETIQTHLGPQSSQTGVRPVTARAIVVAGTLRTIPLAVRLRPDTAIVRAAVTDAYQRFIATIGDEDDDQNESPIGARIEPSRISEAISSASGEYAHDLIVPAAPFTLERTEYPVAAAIVFVD
ncbi:putative phage protein gp47/JayE [Rhizobium skierniewicense]|uniref:Putative phage protein gp47/JayE n=1 Tax=Rhizobium skierniewicense TaxID=984260 RepID=A0A7W6CEP8_9HYPH|nr:baseplate J/gp47 family protein [Rhizobium skierniewicense]MBB3947205.1 putative phage protein gp47/JayE [Rhizobium skierniewicense]